MNHAGSTPLLKDLRNITSSEVMKEEIPFDFSKVGSTQSSKTCC
jgi:hypothetical protein